MKTMTFEQVTRVWRDEIDRRFPNTPGLSMRDVLTFTRLSRVTISEAIADGSLIAARGGKRARVLIPAQGLAVWLANRTQAAKRKHAKADVETEADSLTA